MINKELKHYIWFVAVFFGVIVFNFIFLAGISTQVLDNTLPNFLDEPPWSFLFFFWWFLGIPAVAAYYFAFKKQEGEVSAPAMAATTNETVVERQSYVKPALIILGGFTLLWIGFFWFLSNSSKTMYTFYSVEPGELKDLPATLLQTILTNNCQVNSDLGTFIPTAELPFVIDRKKMPDLLVDEATCYLWWYEGGKPKHWASLRSRVPIRVYNDESDDGGHGGYSRLRSVGIIIKDTGSTKISLYDTSPDGPPRVEDIGMAIRGEKAFETGAEKFYINTDLVLLEPGDQEMVNFLRENGFTETEQEEEMIKSSVGSKEIINAFREQFLADVATKNSTSPFIDKISKLEEILDAFSLAPIRE